MYRLDVDGALGPRRGVLVAAVEIAEFASGLDERGEVRPRPAQRNARERLLQVRLEPRTVVRRMEDGVDVVEDVLLRHLLAKLPPAPRDHEVRHPALAPIPAVPLVEQRHLLALLVFRVDVEGETLRTRFKQMKVGNAVGHQARKRLRANARRTDHAVLVRRRREKARYQQRHFDPHGRVVIEKRTTERPIHGRHDKPTVKRRAPIPFQVLYQTSRPFDFRFVNLRLPAQTSVVEVDACLHVLRQFIARPIVAPHVSACLRPA